MYGAFVPASTSTAGQSKKKNTWKLSPNPPNSPGPRRNSGLGQIQVKFGKILPSEVQAVAHRPMLLAVTLLWPLQVSNLPVPSSLRSKGFKPRSKGEWAVQ